MLLFVHDLRFYEDNEGVLYCSSGLDTQYFDRFFDAGFDAVKILSRKGIKPLGSNISPIRNENISLSRACLKKYWGLFNPFFYLSALKVLRRSQLVVISTPSVIGTFVTIVCWLIRQPYAVEVAGDGDAFLSKKGGWIISSFLNFMMPFFVRHAQGAAYVTNFLASKFPNKKTVVVASNVNIEDVYPRGVLTQPLREKEIVKIGFVGGLNKRKGVDVLLHAASKLINGFGYHNLQFHLVGGYKDFELESMLHELGISENFVLHGLKSKSEVLELMKSFDLYVQPSLSEGLPRASIEAMSCGLPVIATNLPGFCEILDSVVLVSTNDAEGLASKIEELLTSYADYNKQSKNNLKTAGNFLYSNLHQKRCAYYRSFIELTTEEI